MKKLFLIFLLLSSSFALKMNTVMQNRCYTKRMYPLPEKVVFQGLKDTFLKSNINIKNASLKDGFLQGSGIFTNNDDELYSITITSSIRKVNNTTQITTIVSYTKSKKEAEMQTAGVAGVNFPISVPWRKKYSVQDTGNINDPLFFLGFYLNLEKSIYENLMIDNSNLELKEIVVPKAKEIKISNKIKTLDKNITLHKETNQTKTEVLNSTNKEENLTK